MPHIHEKIDFVAGAFIVHKDKVLLRLHEKHKDWFDPGGHVELDEDPSQAAVREAKEEVGLDIKIVGGTPHIDGLASDTSLIIPPRFMQRHRVNDTHEHIAMYYFATSDTDEVVPAEGESGDVWKWFTLEELKDPKYAIRSDIQFYASEALKELGS
jgi:8-oxo-dGTP diphosphatase